MIGVSFNLSPIQTRILVDLAFDNRDPVADGGLPVCHWDCRSFVSSAGSLISKGLVSHSNERKPSWQATEEGKALANLIVSQAEKLAAIRNNAKEFTK